MWAMDGPVNFYTHCATKNSLVGQKKYDKNILVVNIQLIAKFYNSPENLCFFQIEL